VIVEKQGSPETDEQPRNQEEQRERLWRAAERIAERNRDKDPEAELPFITEVVEEVRQEQRESGSCCSVG
jgi:hypothetical protein